MDALRAPQVMARLIDPRLRNLYKAAIPQAGLASANLRSYERSAIMRVLPLAAVGILEFAWVRMLSDYARWVQLVYQPVHCEDSLAELDRLAPRLLKQFGDLMGGPECWRFPKALLMLR